MVFAAVLALAACAADPDRVVPREYRKPIKQAAKECPELSPKLLAAQLDQESGFDRDAVSKAGAEGIAQFVPDTWAVWGQDLDGDGVASPYNAREAIDAQGTNVGVVGQGSRLLLTGLQASGPVQVQWGPGRDEQCVMQVQVPSSRSAEGYTTMEALCQTAGAARKSGTGVRPDLATLEKAP